MNYRISYSCISHTGYCRKMNQDNFICAGIYMNEAWNMDDFPISGSFSSRHPAAVGIFDGMGGEECGEVASFLAAEQASHLCISDEPEEDLMNFCDKANGRICQYAKRNRIGTMGTTAALLAFSNERIGLCNIGDSKIFRLTEEELEQLSVDHVGIAAYGRKPPLTQSLGIPPEEFLIVPYITTRPYHKNDIYLICSDGLTDMVSQEEIAEILTETDFEKAGEKLLIRALENGGRDNITILLCKTEREKRTSFLRFLKR